MPVSEQVQKHYAHGALIDAVDASLRALGKDPARLHVGDLVQIDELHIGGHPATADLIARCAFAQGARILDVGSGMGGPARAFAVGAGVHVTGIDLTPEFVDVAQTLSERTGLADRTAFRQGSALDLPIPDAAFDGAYMIHVGMNIDDKEGLFRQVRRVLRPGATFAVYDIMRFAPDALTFPLPWSSEPETSFVVEPERYRAALAAAGFAITAEVDRRAFARAFFKEAAAQAASGNPAALAHRGRDFATKARNLRGLVEAGVVGPYTMLAKAAP
ncbi:MAG: class I SAM-dependent methyltransferase [Hyphomicrobiaceae bacterium]|nr:class I SAM-dependent methyltransferase [Hyphomicrobiaceae bacterium]